MQLAGEIRQLLRAGNVFAKQHHAAHRVIRQHGGHRIGQGGDAGGIRVVDLLLLLRRVQRVGADKKHLADFFPQRHAGQAAGDRPGKFRLLRRFRLQRSGLFRPGRGLCRRGGRLRQALGIPRRRAAEQRGREQRPRQGRRQNAQLIFPHNDLPVLHGGARPAKDGSFGPGYVYLWYFMPALMEQAR